MRDKLLLPRSPDWYTSRGRMRRPCGVLPEQGSTRSDSSAPTCLVLSSADPVKSISTASCPTLPTLTSGCTGDIRDRRLSAATTERANRRRLGRHDQGKAVISPSPGRACGSLATRMPLRHPSWPRERSASPPRRRVPPPETPRAPTGMAVSPRSPGPSCTARRERAPFQPSRCRGPVRGRRRTHTVRT
eukprot:scaffold538_cov412-Prasinococcus_capsulatus_cf.AAC.12